MPRTKLKRILSLLLDTEYAPISKYELAKKAGCTPSWVVMLTKKLEKEGLLKGLKVTNVNGLFDKFRSIKPKKPVTRSYAIYQLNNVSDFIEILSKSKRGYAFTTYVAENLVQKHLFSHRTDFYVLKEDLDDWHKELTKIGAYGGGNVKIIVSTYDELFNKRQIGNKGGAWIVSMPQLISDLYNEGGPAKEAGDMLLQKLIKSIEARKNGSSISGK